MANAGQVQNRRTKKEKYAHFRRAVNKILTKQKRKHFDYELEGLYLPKKPR